MKECRPMRKARVLLILCFVLVGGRLAAAQPCPPIQVRNPHGNYIVPGVRGEIPYAKGVALDAYAPRRNRSSPAVVVIHGGGWSSGSRIAHVGQLLELLTRAGYSWFSIDYRPGSATEQAASLADVRSALAFVRCHARDFSIDPARLILLGEDSGADLAAHLVRYRADGVVGAILIGGLYDSPIGTGDRGAPSPAGGSAGRAMTKGPSLLMVHGGADRESPVDRARTYCVTAASAGMSCELEEIAGAGHRSENWWPSQWGYKQKIVDWLGKLAPAPAPPARTSSVPLHKDIVFDRVNDLKLDAFLPRSGKPAPAVILVHGGGWEAGDKVTYITPLFEPLAKAGLAWFSIDYRLTPAFTHEEQLADLRSAIRFVRTGHARFNIDPARLVLVGESASGQMVAQIAAEDRSLAGVVSFYGVYDFPAMVTDASPRSLLVRLFRRSDMNDESMSLLRKHSPLYTAHRNMPPMLLVNGTAERLWDQARQFSSRLTELGVSHETVALDGAPHGMENWEGHPEWMFYKQRVVDWILSRFR